MWNNITDGAEQKLRGQMDRWERVPGGARRLQEAGWKSLLPNTGSQVLMWLARLSAWGATVLGPE